MKIIDLIKMGLRNLSRRKARPDRALFLCVLNGAVLFFADKISAYAVFSNKHAFLVKGGAQRLRYLPNRLAFGVYQDKNERRLFGIFPVLVVLSALLDVDRKRRVTVAADLFQKVEMCFSFTEIFVRSRQHCHIDPADYEHP